MSPFCGLAGNLVPKPAVLFLDELGMLSASSAVRARFGIIDFGLGSGGISLINSATTSTA
jgi:hypothetical protein